MSELNDDNFSFCWKCGEKISKDAEFCPKCGEKQKHPVDPCSSGSESEQTKKNPNASPKSRLVTMLLCIFVGGLGVHRFYVGKIGSGIAMILIGWLTFGIWYIIDLIMICCGKFTDSDGKLITDWDLD